MSPPARRFRTTPYGCLHQARFHRPAGPLSQTLRSAAAARKAGEQSSHTARAGCRGTAPGRPSPVPGSGVGDWSAGAPWSQPPAILWYLSDRSERYFAAEGMFRRPGGGFLCPRRQRNQSAVFSGPFGRKRASGGQTLSGCPLSFQATGPWLGKGLSPPLSFGPPGLCHAVWRGDKRRRPKDAPTILPTPGPRSGQRAWPRPPPR